MSTQVTLTLSDEVYQRVECFARLANRDVASILADTIFLAIPTVSSESAELSPISDLSDEQVMELTQLQMDSDHDTRLSQLLDRQQEGLLAVEDQIELQVLMQVYQEGLLRKATALSEAVKRGLMEPLGS